ncbi:hypothetical protein [Stenotrophomonas sp.]|uniref:hypothetical protein n=1 Tax=Stenotrophomonas sp. TaxID=69392 RepID=UPI0028AD907C|nr:hypothetical protein [Stenotrophomonas sp.]
MFKRLQRPLLVLLSALSLTLSLPALACPVAGPPSAANAPTIASSISTGHAFTKHGNEFVHGVVIAGLAFPDPTIATPGAFATFLQPIVGGAGTNKPLSNSRHAFWDARTGTVVIFNPGASDCGTAFRPTAGQAYYTGLK